MRPEAARQLSFIKATALTPGQLWQLASIQAALWSGWAWKPGSRSGRWRAPTRPWSCTYLMARRSRDMLMTGVGTRTGRCLAPTLSASGAGRKPPQTRCGTWPFSFRHGQSSASPTCRSSLEPATDGFGIHRRSRLCRVSRRIRFGRFRHICMAHRTGCAGLWTRNS